MSKLKNIPIFIPAKCNSDDDMRLYKMLLPYAYRTFKRAQALRQVFVISNNEEFTEYAKELGFHNTYYEHCEDCHENKITYEGVLRFFKNNKNVETDWFIMWNLRRPFKEENLILRIITNINDNYDFLTTYYTTYDVDRYYINENEQIQKYSLPNITEKKILDNAVFACKLSFVQKISKSKNPEMDFWNGKYKIIHNEGLHYDILNEYELNQLINASKAITEIQAMTKKLS